MLVMSKLMYLGDSGRLREQIVENHTSRGTVSHPWKNEVSLASLCRRPDTRMNKLCFENHAKETCHVIFQQLQRPSAHCLWLITSRESLFVLKINSKLSLQFFILVNKRWGAYDESLGQTKSLCLYKSTLKRKCDSHQEAYRKKNT
jgi:hypothetical protein